VKFGRPEIDKVVRYLPDKKNKIGSLSRYRFCADGAQNLPRPAANNVLNVPQISSKSVHFRRSYSRTHEHSSNAPQSVSNTRRSFSLSNNAISRIVATKREWISSVNNSRLDAATSRMKVIPCTDSAVQGNDFELIPTIRMERGQTVEGLFSREFSSIYIVREL